MKTMIYIINSKHWNLQTSDADHVANHGYVERDDQCWCWPVKLDKGYPSLEDLDELMENQGTSHVLILDRWNGSKTISVIDHVNRSGQSILRGKTPFGNRPQFPDISTVYSPVPEYDTGYVETVGPERFSSTENETNTSEICGIVAPAFSYLGATVKTLCIPRKKTKQFKLKESKQ